MPAVPGSGSEMCWAPPLDSLSFSLPSFILYSYLHFHFFLVCVLPLVLCYSSLYGSLHFFPRVRAKLPSGLPCYYPEHAQCFPLLGQNLGFPSFSNEAGKGRSGIGEQAVFRCPQPGLPTPGGQLLPVPFNPDRSHLLSFADNTL